jgi:hypothetical protein
MRHRPHTLVRVAVAALAVVALAAPAAGAQQNLVTNGTFETLAGSGPANWFGANPGGANWGVRQAPHTGTFALYLQGDSRGFSTPASYSAAGQTIATTAGQAYSISFWALNGSQASTPNRLQVLFGGVMLFDEMLTNSGSENYQQFTITGVASGAATDLVFRGWHQGSGNNIDDVTMVAASTTPPVSTVPEPATWALMSVGLVGVLGGARRRARA